MQPLNYIFKFFQPQKPVASPTTPRPIADLTPPNISTGKVEIPSWPFSYVFLWDLALTSDVTRLTISNIRSEVFRRGFEIKPVYQSKCTANECGKEYNFKTQSCEYCGNPTRNVDQGQIKRWNNFFYTKCNNLAGGQTFLDVLNELEEDLNIADNAFALLIKNYAFSEHGEIQSAHIKEFQRIHPANIRLVRNTKGESDFLYTCPIHRSKGHDKPGRCDECNKILYPVEFSAVEANGGTGASPKFYYIVGEVKHLTRYTPTSGYGYPPLFTIWQKILTEIQIDKYTMDSYSKQRNPQQMLIFHTNNMPALEKAISQWNTLTNINPYKLVPFGMPKNPDGSKDEPTLIDLTANMPNIEDLRSSIRNNIAAFYGVSPIMMGDTSTGSGLHNESLQITVSNRRVETNQATYHYKLFPWLCSQLGIYDWEIELLPSEEKDEAADLQRELTKVQIAQQMQQMGFKVTRNDNGEFEFSKTPELPALNSPQLTPPSEEEQRQSGVPEKNFGDYRNFSEVVKSFQSVRSTELQKELDKLIEKELANLKDKPSKLQLKRAAGRLSLSLPVSAESVTKEKLKEFYKEQLKAIAKKDVLFSAQSENNLNSIFGSSIFKEAYVGLSNDLSKALNQIIEEKFTSPGELSLNEIVKEMKAKAANIAETHLETIARTEVHNVSMLAREEAYDYIRPDIKVKWLNPNDSRTTSICKNISKRAQRGVSLEELRKIIKEEADPAAYRADRPYSPHINCRSVFA